MGSPAALAQTGLEEKLRMSATDHGLYVPSGAFWGSDDIRKMADRGNLQVSREIVISFWDDLCVY